MSRRRKKKKKKKARGAPRGRAGWRPQLVLSIVATDDTFEEATSRKGPGWLGKCIHCESKLFVPASGSRERHVTIEHIVPRNHGGTDELENLSLACGRCNGAKGRRLDNRSWADPDLQAMIQMLQARRRERWRDPCVPSPHR